MSKPNNPLNMSEDSEFSRLFKTKDSTFYGVGVGPGDPLLLTLKAHLLIQSAHVISYIANTQGHSQARDIARISIAQRQSAPHIEPLIEVPVPMPMSTDRRQANVAYDKGALEIMAHLNAGRSVVFLCEGDPLFFGSFTYLLQRIDITHPCQVIPGIASVHAAAAQLAMPLTLQQESLVVVSGRHSDQQIQQALSDHDSVVIMKAGQARPRILALLKATKRWHDGHYLEYVGRSNQYIEHNLDHLANQAGPYFSLFVVLRQERLA